MKKEIVSLIAPPGAGKTTLADLFCAKTNAPKISTSGLLIAAGYDVSHGKLVSDDVVMACVYPEILGNLDSGNVVLLDGAPRTIQQLDFLASISWELNARLSVVFLNTPLQVAVERYNDRVNKTPIEKRRADDLAGEIVLRERYDEYEKWTRPIVESMVGLESIFNYIEVSGVPAPDEIMNDLVSKLSIN